MAAFVIIKLIVASSTENIGDEACRSHSHNVAVFGQEREIERVKSTIGPKSSLPCPRHHLSIDIDACIDHQLAEANPMWQRHLFVAQDKKFKGNLRSKFLCSSKQTLV